MTHARWKYRRTQDNFRTNKANQKTHKQSISSVLLVLLSHKRFHVHFRSFPCAALIANATEQYWTPYKDSLITLFHAQSHGKKSKTFSFRASTICKFSLWILMSLQPNSFHGILFHPLAGYILEADELFLCSCTKERKKTNCAKWTRFKLKINFIFTLWSQCCCSTAV